jgi:hypothetical protein
LPVVFEVRDSLNRPVTGRRVALAGVNAVLQAAPAATDSMGQLTVYVVLGPRAGPAAVTATLDGLERQAPLVAVAGPPARLAVRCGDGVVGRLALGAGETSDLVVAMQDAHGNVLAATDVRSRLDDERVARIVAAGADRLTLRAERAGTTRLEVTASGLRAELPVVVGPAAAGPAPCRRSVPGG